MSKHGRRLAVSATLAATATLGSTFPASPAFAADSTSTAASAATASVHAEAAAQQVASTATAAATAAAAIVTPIVKLTANHSVVAAGQTVTFTATEKTPAGTAIESQAATLSVRTASGWSRVASKTTSAAGVVRFAIAPKHDHMYQVHFPAVVGTSTAASTAHVSVKMDIGSAIVAAAAAEKGRPYVFGAAGPRSFDCSGLVKFVLAKFGVVLPHQANQQKAYGTRVSASHAQPGDLVFVLSGSYATHVAIYAGHGTWWEAPHTGASVRHVKIWSSSVEYRRVR